MSRTAKLMIAALALVMLSLTGGSAIQVTADTSLTLPGPVSNGGPSNICNNRFIACGGLQTCPSGCWCDECGTASGLCRSN